MALSKTDPHGIITYVNEKFCTLSGYKRHEIVGNSYAMFRSIRESDKKLAELWETISSGGQWHDTIENRAKNGDHFILDQTIFPLYDTDNRIIEYISIGDDVTELFHYRDFLEVELLKIGKIWLKHSIFLNNTKMPFKSEQPYAICHSTGRSLMRMKPFALFWIH